MKKIVETTFADIFDFSDFSNFISKKSCFH